MNMVLQWRRPDPPIVLGWRGPDGVLASAILVDPARSIPTIIGPPGVAGPAGVVGPAGPIADVIDAGTFA